VQRGLSAIAELLVNKVLIKVTLNKVIAVPQSWELDIYYAFAS